MSDAVRDEAGYAYSPAMSLAPWMPHLPSASTPAERVALARERFFVQGQRPTGLVSETVLQSWQRCLAERRDRFEALEIQPISRLRLEGALRRTRLLREAAKAELKHLKQMLAQAACTITLFDAQGLVVYDSWPSWSGEPAPLLKPFSRVGVDGNERVLGTNAPHLVLLTGRACTLGAGDHYFELIKAAHCASAPIRDIRGRIAGVLDLGTVSPNGFGFDAGALVGLHAVAMERALMRAQSRHQTLVELQVHPALGPAGVGLLGVDDQDRIAWLDATAQRYTGVSSERYGGPCDCEAVLGLKASALRALAGRDAPVPVPLPNGLGVWISVRAPVKRGVTDSLAAIAADADDDESQPPQAPPPPLVLSLAEQERALILQTLEACSGNVSETARRLGISRGRVYRAAPGAA